MRKKGESEEREIKRFLVALFTTVANPDEQSGKWQGDIMLSMADLGRNGVIATSRRWPNGVIPYVIEGHSEWRNIGR